MKFLVTGGAGFIGSHLVDVLINQGHEVSVLDNLASGKKENLNPKAKFFQKDIRNFDEIKPLFKNLDGVFHLAAVPRVPLSIADPVGTASVNIGGTINVFTAAKDAGVKRLVYSSSSSAYGDQKIQPLKETFTPNPISPYGLQKLVGELHAKLFSNLYAMEIVSLRFFNVFGPRIDLGGAYASVMGSFIKASRAKQPLPVYGGGEQTRGFSYVSDVVAAVIAGFTSKKIKGGEVINIGNRPTTINQLAKLFNGKIEYQKPRVGDILYSSADTSLAKELLGWEPKISLEDGVALLKKSFGV